MVAMLWLKRSLFPEATKVRFDSILPIHSTPLALSGFAQTSFGERSTVGWEKSSKLLWVGMVETSITPSGPLVAVRFFFAAAI